MLLGVHVHVHMHTLHPSILCTWVFSILSPTHLSSKVPGQEVDGILLSLEAESLGLWVDPVLNIDASCPVYFLVGHASQPTQEGCLTSLTSADEEQLNGAVMD